VSGLYIRCCKASVKLDYSIKNSQLLNNEASVVERLSRKATGEFQYADESEDGFMRELNFRQISYLRGNHQHDRNHAVVLALCCKISNIELDFSILCYFVGKGNTPSQVLRVLRQRFDQKNWMPSVAFHLAGKHSAPCEPTGKHNFMHNKVVCDDAVVTGSFNFSRNATMNAENILVIHNATIANQYNQYIDQLIEVYGQPTKKSSGKPNRANQS